MTKCLYCHYKFELDIDIRDKDIIKKFPISGKCPRCGEYYKIVGIMKGG